MKYKLKGSPQETQLNTVLANRKLTLPEVRCHSFVSISHFSDYINLERAAKTLMEYMKVGKKIGVLVDTDTDGYCSSAMLVNYCREVLDYNNLEILMHKDKRHGLYKEIVDNITDLKLDLIIIPDGGSNNFDWHKILFYKGVGVIVLDHHETTHYSEHALVVNNQLQEGVNKNLSGAGVVYKFLEAMDQYSGNNKAGEYLDLFAVANVADVMDMSNVEVRYLCKQGFANIKNSVIKAILTLQDMDIKDIDFKSISFKIAPWINALIRIGTHEEKVEFFSALIGIETLEKVKVRGQGEVEMLTSEKCARNCKTLKGRQDRIVKQKVESLVELIEEEGLNRGPILVVKDNNILPTLTGLIAMKLADKFMKPTLLLRDMDNGNLGGSGRTCDKVMVNFKDYLKSLNIFELLEGHQGAFGAEINSTNIKRLDCSNFKKEELVHEVDYAFENMSSIDSRLVIGLDELKKEWSKGFEQPLFYFEHVIQDSSTVNFIGKGDTLKIKGYGLFSLMKFRCSEEERVDFTGEYPKKIKCVGTIEMNHWNGNSYPQVIIKEYEIEEMSESNIFIF